jgi:hypothetical protein
MFGGDAAQAAGPVRLAAGTRLSRCNGKTNPMLMRRHLLRAAEMPDLAVTGPHCNGQRAFGGSIL